MVSSYTAAPDIEVLTSNFPIPGYGLAPVNALVIKGSEPILVETGMAIESADFMQALRSAIDPADLRWIRLSHTDFDHIGSVHQLLKENPRLRVITTFLGMGIMGLTAPLLVIPPCRSNRWLTCGLLPERQWRQLKGRDCPTFNSRAPSR